jgi:hypothetical protein
MDPCLVQPPSPHTSYQTSLSTDPLQGGGCRAGGGAPATDIAYQLTAHDHLAEGTVAVATLGLAYIELVAV